MISPGACRTFLLEALQGIHQPSDDYRLAMYGEDASLGIDTDTYTSKGEVKGKGYQAGGQSLTGYKAGWFGGDAGLAWDSPLWDPATIDGARGALIYNRTRGNRALQVLDFGEVGQSMNGPFKVLLPVPAVVLRPKR